ncbi:cysteine--tRNA ligase [Methanonatronarchaeum sp. AMET-Sl]|uniref:cysteine--tRNA ligase n=1 Tax=Methanonatronarchaeum sp. AMET-Sl TaxID=3037654 RepID=UPI00244DFBCD|nr:cysteine--tRNA ligase [Methanonatronarchaeum sp. AMET-Sl]WGI17033.1 cysteine--tRNA ligase [Methanonatronarchaeum sp. AMET-Sl]
MTIQVYNTLSGELEDFEPLEEGKVGLYVCGTTDYDYIHLGHARTYVAYDMMVRYFEWKGFDVKYIQNITDVGHLTDEGEDKVEKRAKSERSHPMEIVEYYMRKHLRDVDELKIKRPDIMPRATGHLIDMIEAVKDLVDKGFAYESNGSVYFDVSKLDEYGELSNIVFDDLEESGRVGASGEKKDPRDFALWKKADEDQLMSWPSPWGEGFPGWHIECTVMSTKYLGEKFDIHGGAIELGFPHHENEIAQGKALCGTDPVRYWVHTGLLNVGGEKMSKSKGNFITVREALDKHDPEVLRLWILSSHYRSPVDYTVDKIEEAEKQLDKILNFYDRLNRLESDGAKGELSDLVDNLIVEFETKMDKDFNSPEALSKVFQFIKEANRKLDEGQYEAGDPRYVIEKLEEILNIFGILPENLFEEDFNKEVVGEILDEILELREELREKGEYEMADKIRDKLEKAGVSIEDREKPTWEIKR